MHNELSKRSHALDALRGYAIMTMVLSAMEIFQVLPAWMYHAQVPPPDHVFNPHIYGITWVDLIFPFFLFSMGAAIPLSFRRQISKGVSRRKLAWKSIVRWFKLTFFAIYCIHMYPFMMGYQSPVLCCVVPMLAFLLMFVLFMRNPFHLPRLWDRIVNGAAYVVAVAWLLLQPYADGQTFSLNTADIIMLILAQVAVTGSLIYLATINNKLGRILIVPVIMALFMSAHTDGSWQQWFLDSSPVAWLWNWRFQEYLLIIIPGTLAGDLLWANLNSNTPQPTSKGIAEATLSFAIIVCNVVCLYNRWLVANLIISFAIIATLLLFTRKKDPKTYWRQLIVAGSYILTLGLCLEAYEGGIRKDDVTLSYLFVTGALAVFALLFFTIVCDHWHVKWISWPLEMTGRNPMVAYVAGSMVVIPLLQLLQLWQPLVNATSTPWLGFLRGVLLTAMTMAVAIICSKRKWFWKT